MWANMVARCTNPWATEFHRYGGRGITVCDEWMDIATFIADIERILGPKPKPSYSLDRTDNDSGYSPTNVRWASKRTQALNRKRSFVH